MKCKADPRIFYYPICALLIAVFIIWDIFGASFALNKLNMNDFGKFYYSTTYFLQNQDMYGPSPATLIPISQSEYKQFWNMNPPHFHLFILPFASLSPVMAFYAWIITGFICLVISIFMILRESHLEVNPLSLSLVILAVLAFSGTYTTLVTGQISFFIFLCVTLAWLSARRGKWLHSAIFIGICISVKFFFLILVPFLIVRHQLLSASLALLVTIIIFIAGIMIFGLASYAAWISAMAGMDWAWAAMNGSVFGVLTRILSPSPHFLPFIEAKGLILNAWIIIATLICIITIILTAKDHSPNHTDRGFALFLVAALLICPLGWIYYSWILIGPAACLIHYWYKEQKYASQSFLKRIRNFLLLIASICSFLPLPILLSFQPGSVATLTVGSAYFWGFIAFWMVLISDYFYQYHLSKCLNVSSKQK